MECIRLGVEDRGTNPISNAEAYTIVSCSSLSWYKRPLLLVEVLKHLTIPVRWIHLGDGPMRDAFLEASSQLPGNIKFEFKGSISNTEVISFYQQNPVDLVLNLSSFEGIPVSLMEAISFGIPIAGCNVCGIPEIVNSNTGLLLDMSPNPKGTASVIIDFLKTKSRNGALREGVKEYWEQNFKANKNYPQFLKRLENKSLWTE
jgi:glycosyltransferase involved in cell wall biosynthesis